MNDIYITLTGNVASEPRQYTFEDGVRVTSLRVLTSHRYFDKKTGQWADGEKVCFAVRCWRALADNVAQSIRVGHPVVVSGKLRIREFGAEDDRRFMAEVEASSVGHDLRWGTGVFSKPERGASIVSRERRERLDEDTQDWAMGGGRPRSGGAELDPAFGTLESRERVLTGGDPFRAALPAAAGEVRVLGSSGWDSGGAFQPAGGDLGLAGGLVPPETGDAGAAQEVGPGPGPFVKGEAGAAGEPVKGEAGVARELMQAEAVNPRELVKGEAGSAREAVKGGAVPEPGKGGVGAVPESGKAGAVREPGKGGAETARGRRRGRREEPEGALDDGDALVRVLGAAGDGSGDPVEERAAA
ncbi:single-stranded DNA-binding protein [Nonomuraea endophytica]|uniref:Single-stranded DNA-binding protein n=1 Tax=Nonomuraea endophytica TaxID=714136 RepID=A0A7W7ZYL4_9ACTN|nr:single-stranded DNA-binding protein [Nonomuraea endophytica]MBB5076245.1 single-stranded DNA-binding protein [Nonomuraea endophytica]